MKTAKKTVPGLSNMYDTFVYEQVFPSFQVVHFSHIGHIVTLKKH